MNKMAKILDMQFIRYINLLEKVSGVSTTNCFMYNNTLYFAVPKSKFQKAVGPRGANVKKISETLRKKIKIIEMPSTDVGIKKFVLDLISPIEVNSIEVKDGELIISAVMQSRAMIIGRDRAREKEMIEILNKLFGITSVKISQ